MADRGPKRRRRGGLEPTAHELRYAGHSQLRQCYLDGSKSLYQGDIAGAFRRHRRASAAVRASRRPVPLPAALERLSRGHLGHLGRHLAAARRDGIRYLYEVVHKSPPEEEWGGRGGTISLIAHALDILGDRRPIRNVLEHIKAVAELSDDTLVYDAAGVHRYRGRKPKLEDGTEESMIVCDAKEKGWSNSQVAAYLSEARIAKNIEPIGVSAVQAYVDRSELFDLHKRTSRKSGSSDPDKTWCKARHAQCLQIKIQLELVPKFLADVEGDMPNPFGDLPPLFVDGILFVDEHHQKVVVGSNGKHECLVSRDEDGLPKSIQEGGKFPPPKPFINYKYENEVRGAFAACIKKRPDGSFEGCKADPYGYTGSKVVGPARYEEEYSQEYERVLLLGGCWGGPSCGYQQRYGDNWEEELKKAVDKKHRNINDIIDWAIDEGNRLFAGTDRADDWVIWHDALSAWFSEGAQAHLAYRGFYHRQVRCQCGTNDDVAHYKRKLVGDSPELMRALDAYGFADLRQGILDQVVATVDYKNDDPRKFRKDTQPMLWSSVCRVWKDVAPSSERIVEDITALPRVLDRIIEAKGTIVPDIFFRTGRRYRSKADDRDLERKPSRRQRIETNLPRPLHPDAVAGKDAVFGK